MKKMLIVALAVFFTFGFVGLIVAQNPNDSPELQAWQQKYDTAKTMKFDGEVLSHDVKCHCFIVKTAKGNLTLQDDYAKMDQEYDRAKGLKVGGKAMGEYKSVNMINYATTVHQK